MTYLPKNLPLEMMGKSKTQIARTIENSKSTKGGWTSKTLASWGVSWPPLKGWKKHLISMGSGTTK